MAEMKPYDGPVRGFQPYKGPIVRTPTHIETPEPIPSRGLRGDVDKLGRWLGSRGEYKPLTDQMGDPMPETQLEGVPFNKTLKIAVGSFAEREPKHLAEIMRKHLPQGWKVETTRRDDIILTDPKGKQSVYNKRGASWRDLEQVADELVKGAVAATPVGKAIRPLMVGAKLGAGAAVTSLAEDAGSRALGSSRQVSLKKAGMAGAAGVLTGMGAAYVGKLLRAVKSSGLSEAGKLTPKGEKLLTDAGVDTSRLSPETIGELHKILKRAGNPQEAVRMAKARSLKVPVTKSDVTQNPKHLAGEERISQSLSPVVETPNVQRLRALKGPQADTVRPGSQLDAINQGKEAVALRVSGAGIDEPGVAIGSARKALSDAAKTSSKGVSAAYQAAKAPNALVKPDALQPFARELRSIRREFVGHDATVKTIDAALRDIKSASRPGTTLRLNYLEDRIRKGFGNLRSETDATGRAASARLKAAYDKMVRGLPDDAYTRGPGAADAFRAATARKAEHATLFENNPVIRKVLKERKGVEGYDFAIAPQEVRKTLFGANNSRISEGIEAVKVMKKVLGKKAFASLKNEVAADLVSKGPAQMNKMLEGERGALLKEIFTPKELTQFKTFADVKNLTTRGIGATRQQGPGTAMTLMRDAGSLIPGPVRNYARGVGDTFTARSALNYTPTGPVPLGLRAPAGATAVNEERVKMVPGLLDLLPTP